MASVGFQVSNSGDFQCFAERGSESERKLTSLFQAIVRHESGSRLDALITALSPAEISMGLRKDSGCDDSFVAISALHLATRTGQIDAIRCLLGRGADPFIPDLARETPLDFSVQKKVLKEFLFALPRVHMRRGVEDTCRTLVRQSIWVPEIVAEWGPVVGDLIRKNRLVPDSAFIEELRERNPSLGAQVIDALREVQRGAVTRYRFAVIGAVKNAGIPPSSKARLDVVRAGRAV